MTQQLDYIYLFYGFGFILLAVVCFVLGKRKELALPWTWLGMFGLIHGLNEWLDMLALSLADSTIFLAIRVCVMAASFVFLVEFGRLGNRSISGKCPGRWVTIALFATACVGGVLGWVGLSIFFRYSLGLVGGIWTAVTFILASRRMGKRSERRLLIALGVLFATYAIVGGIIVPKAAFLPASLLNNDAFLQIFGFPVQLLRAVVAMASAGCVWQFLQSRNYKAYIYVFIFSVLGVLTGGWFLVNHTGAVAERNVRDNMHASCALAAASITDKMLGKTDSIKDLNSPGYIFLKNRLTDIKDDYAMYRLVYTMIVKNGEIIFSVDSEPPSSKDYTPPGDKYTDAPAELLALCRGEGQQAMAEYSDKWGKWVSAFVPIRDETTGKVAIVLGIDMSQEVYKSLVAHARLEPIVITLLVLMLLAAFYFSYEKQLETFERISVSDDLLRKNDANLSITLKSIGDGVISTDAESCVVHINPMAEQLTGWSLAEAIGHPVSEIFNIVNTLTQEKAVVPVHEVVSTGEVSHLINHTTLISRDGTLRQIAKSAAPIRDDDGVITGVVLVFSDVTEQYRIREMLQIKTSLLDAQMNASLDGILVIDENKRIIVVNRRVVELFNIPKDIADSDDDALWLQHAVSMTKYPDLFIAKIMDLYDHPDQSSRDEIEFTNGMLLDRYSAPVVGEDGHNFGRIWTFRDITERKQAEQDREKALLQEQGVSHLRQLLLAPGALEDKLKIVTDGIVSLFDADFCRVWVTMPGDLCEQGCIHAEEIEGLHVCRQRDMCLRLLASSGRYTHLDGEVHRRVPFGCYKIGLIAAGEDHKFLTNDVQNDSRVHNNEWARGLGLMSFAGYQLYIPNGDKLGVLGLFSKHSISAAEDAMFDGLSTTVATVIQQALAEQALRESEENLLTTLHSIGDAVISTDAEGLVLRMNPVAEEMTGWSWLDAIGRPISEVFRIINALTCEMAAIPVHEVMSTGEICHLTNHTTLIARDGTQRQIADSAAPIRDSSGAITGVVLVFSDVTEQYCIREKLMESEERYRGLFESAGDAIMTMAPPSWLFTSCNPAAMGLFGITSVEELTSIGPWAISSDLQPDGRASSDKAKECIETAVREGSNSFEWMSKKMNGEEFPTCVLLSRMEHCGNLIIQSTVRDISELKRLEKERKLNEDRTQTLLRLNQMTDASVKDISLYALEECIKLTSSKIGYLAFVSEDETVLTMQHWSNSAMAECAMIEKPIVYQMDQTGLWGEAVRQRRAIITNDYSAPSPHKRGTPEGHVALTRHMNVPVFDGDHIVAVAGVGNKEIDYNESDTHHINLIMDGLWKILTQKNATELLRAGKERYQALIEQASDGILIYDDTDICVEANQSTCNMLGYSREELLSTSLIDTVNQDDYERLTDEIHRLHSGEVVVAEWMLRCKNGVLLPAEISGKKQFDGSIPIMFRDISERKLADAAREGYLQQLQQVIDAIPIPVFFKNPEGFYMGCNTTFSDMQFMSTDEIIGMTACDLYTDETAEIHKMVDLLVLENEGSQEYKCVVELCDGTVHDFVFYKAQFKNADGATGGIVGTMLDVTEYDSALRELEKAHSETELLIKSIPSILIRIDSDGNILRWNTTAEKVIGITSEEAIGGSLVDSNVSWDVALIINGLEECKRTCMPVHPDEIKLTNMDGQDRIIGVTFSPVMSDTGEYVGCLLYGSDITERKIMEIQLVGAQKLESIGNLAAGIAHEINTPTQYVGDNTKFLQYGFGALLKLIGSYKLMSDAAVEGILDESIISQVRDTESQTKMDFLQTEIPLAIEQSLEGIARVTRIVGAMKEFSHPSTSEKVFFDLNASIETTVTVARNEWKYVAEMVLDLDHNLPPIPCYPDELNQVILNITINAAHAIGDANKESGQDKGTITIKTTQNGQWVDLMISDTGSGIPESVAKKIFDPFFTTKGVGKGTGQGLAISRSIIVDKHQGTISFESETGKGTTFHIKLPLYIAEEMDVA